MWQKVWAGEDRRSVVFGGATAFVLIMTAVFLFGFGGWLANWGGLIEWTADGMALAYPNVVLFQVFKDEAVSRWLAGWFVGWVGGRFVGGGGAWGEGGPRLAGLLFGTDGGPAPHRHPLASFPLVVNPGLHGDGDGGPTCMVLLPCVCSLMPRLDLSLLALHPQKLGMPARVSSWVGVIAIILAAIMNESAVDSLQSGLTNAMSSHFFQNQHIAFARFTVLLINIPMIVISTQVRVGGAGGWRLADGGAEV